MSWQEAPSKRRPTARNNRPAQQSTLLDFSNPLPPPIVDNCSSLTSIFVGNSSSQSYKPAPVNPSAVAPPAPVAPFEAGQGLRYRGSDSHVSTPSRESTITVESSTELADSRKGSDADFQATYPKSFVEELVTSLIMPCRERTSEFRTTAKSLQMKQAASNGHVRSSKQHLVQSSVQFNNLARRIGRDVSQTCAKLEKLATLAKRRSLFDDRVTEVEELTNIVKQDITGLNKQIGQLQSVVQSNQGGKQGENHSRTVVLGLQSRLAAVSTEFKSVLETRTQNLKQQKTRREQFSHSAAVPSSLPPSASTGYMGSVLLADDAQHNGSVTLDMDSLQQHSMQEQASLIDNTDSYIAARSSAMETVESSIAELGQIFRQLAHLVSEQGESIQRIDTNIEQTSINVEAAHHELLRYFRNISRNRWLAIKVFGVLIVFFIIFIIFMT